MPQTTMNGNIYDLTKMELNTIKTMKKVKQKVKFLLEKYPETKGDDRLLIYRFYKVFEDNVLIKPRYFEALMRATSYETITRARRKIQENGELLPTDRTISKRRLRERIIHEASVNDEF